MKIELIMKEWFILLVFFLFLQNFSFAQKIDLKAIKEKLEVVDKGIIIINGVPYELAATTKVDSVLNLFSIESLVELTKIKNEGQFAHMIDDVVVITFTYQQKEKDIKRVLKDLNNKFPDQYFGYSQHILVASKNPVLLIEGKNVHHTEAQKEIKKLKPRDIQYIVYKKDSVSAEMYGQNGKNGLVRIWLK